MKPTRASTIVLVAAIALVVGFLSDATLASRQLPSLRLASALGITLIIIAIVLIGMAVPVRRYARGRADRPIDPLYATRVVLLAKASSVCGALLGAFAAGLVLFALTRSAVPALDSVVPNVVTFVGGLVLTVCAIVAERMCILPPRDDDRDDRDHRGGDTVVR